MPLPFLLWKIQVSVFPANKFLEMTECFMGLHYEYPLDYLCNKSADFPTKEFSWTSCWEKKKPFSQGTIYSPEKIFVILTNHLSTWFLWAEWMEGKHKIYKWFSSFIHLRTQPVTPGWASIWIQELFLLLPLGILFILAHLPIWTFFCSSYRVDNLNFY